MKTKEAKLPGTFEFNDDANKDGDQLVGLVLDRSGCLGWHDLMMLKQFDPVIGFVEFLKCTLDLADFIIGRFSPARLTILRAW